MRRIAELARNNQYQPLHASAILGQLSLRLRLCFRGIPKGAFCFMASPIILPDAPARSSRSLCTRGGRKGSGYIRAYKWRKPAGLENQTVRELLYVDRGAGFRRNQWLKRSTSRLVFVAVRW
jgi:hypothetical protein